MTSSQPLTFSVIVNTIDRAEPLRTLLCALEHQTYPHFEVIAVVGPTRDRTLDVLADYGDRVEVLRCAAANLSASRNVGLLAARGDVAAFIDDDAVPSRRWLEQLAVLFEDEELNGTGGMVYCVHPSMPAVQHRIGVVSCLAEQTDVRSSCADGLPPPGVGRQWTPRMMGTNMAYRRDRLLAVGGFDEFFEWVYDDADVAIRLASSGHPVEPVKEAVVYHSPASSRNRKAYSWNFRSWVQTKSVVYFMMKNGRVAGESARTIAYRCARFVHGRWILGGNLRREGNLGWIASSRMRALEMMGGAQGAWHGLRDRRRLIPPEVAAGAAGRRSAIRAFPNASSPCAPSVDPVAARPLATSLPEPPLRLCLLSHSYPPFEIEGVGRHTSLMARGLAELGHTVHVVTRGDREQTTFRDGAYVHRIKPRLDRYARFADFPDLYHTLNDCHAIHDKLRRLVLNDGIELVDSPLWKVGGLTACLAGLLPVVVRVQTANKQVSEIQRAQGDDARLVGELEQSLLERASFLVANSHATVDAIRRVYGVAATPDRCAVIPHGIAPIDDEEVRPVPATDAARGRTILYVGRLERRKGVLDLFAAIPRVLRRHPEARFVLAGADNSHNDGFQRRMGTTYATHFLRRHPAAAHAVEFLGPVSDERLARLYAACDLFVAPSLYESFGLIYLEAMNWAKPVIGCRAGGIPEVVEHGVTGLLVEPEAPSALAEAIVSLLDSPVRLREYGLAGRGRLLERFTHRRMAEAFASVYRALVRRSAGEPPARMAAS
ncbi:MAG TPA: glycosyltransferase [Candidatus Binatia bacterium]|nr:glycosyltransferase [Candidatus Binatia bacterium]